MKHITQTIIHEIKKILQRDDIKKEFKLFLKPMIDMILEEIYPYIFMSVTFVFISFLLTLAIFGILLHLHLKLK
jgi:hypothetical protein